MIVKVKRKMLYVKVKALYKSVSFVEQNKSYTKYFFYSLYIFHHTSIFIYYSLDTDGSTEIHNKNEDTLKLHSII